MRTHCKLGHELSGSNLRLRTQGRRVCRICDRLAAKASHERRRLIGWTEEEKEKRRIYMREYKNNRKSHMKVLARGSYFKRLYGITITEFESMVEEQKESCALCGKRKKLFVDHCHKTKKVRALLCAQCNWGLGQFHDNPQLIRAAADYLERY